MAPVVVRGGEDLDPAIKSQDDRCQGSVFRVRVSGFSVQGSGVSVQGLISINEIITTRHMDEGSLVSNCYLKVAIIFA